MIKVFLVTDAPAVRQGLRMRVAVEPDLVIVGAAADGAAALRAARTLAPDVVVVDLEMLKTDGLRLLEWLHELAPSIPTIALSVRDHPGARNHVRKAGANAFAGKREPVERLLGAIRCVVRPGNRESEEAPD
jgi:DNA-binding NarL/FixJ family response regulator